jgi:hypothetical protein
VSALAPLSVGVAVGLDEVGFVVGVDVWVGVCVGVVDWVGDEVVGVGDGELVVAVGVGVTVGLLVGVGDALAFGHALGDAVGYGASTVGIVVGAVVLGPVTPEEGAVVAGDVTYWVGAVVGRAVVWQAPPDAPPAAPFRDAVVPVPPERLALPGRVPLPAAEPPPLPPVRPDV